MISWMDFGSIDSVHGAAYVSVDVGNGRGNSRPLTNPASFKNQMLGVCN